MLTIHKTRFAELGYVHLHDHWRFIDKQSPSRSHPSGFATIGPHYATQNELLADLERYAALYGAKGATYKQEQKPRRLLVEHVASTLDAWIRCHDTGNQEWFDKHGEELNRIERNLLPSGSGIDSGTQIDLGESKPDKLVFTTSFHHTNENGYYDGWTEHNVIVRPTFIGRVAIRITGRDRNEIKDYLAEVFQQVLTQELTEDCKSFA